jgi:hypothetical protein
MRLVRIVDWIGIRPGGPTRLAAAILRRAWVWPILVRPPVRATPPCVLWFGCGECVEGLASRCVSAGLWSGTSHKIKQSFST